MRHRNLKPRLKTRGVSAVVATVLLIVITFVAIGIVVGIIIPMVKESLGKGKSCFDLREHFKILESEYSCYNSTDTKLMVERGMDNFSVKGFVVNIISEGASKRYDIYPGATGMKILNGTVFITPVDVPKPGEANTYLFNIGDGKGAEIAVLQTDDGVCDANFYNIPDCSSFPAA